MKMIGVPLVVGGTLFLHGYNEAGELIFHSSFNPQRMQTEPVLIKDSVCYVGLYSFPAEHLNKLNEEPIDNQG